MPAGGNGHSAGGIRAIEASYLPGRCGSRPAVWWKLRERPAVSRGRRCGGQWRRPCTDRTFSRGVPPPWPVLGEGANLRQVAGPDLGRGTIRMGPGATCANVVWRTGASSVRGIPPVGRVCARCRRCGHRVRAGWSRWFAVFVVNRWCGRAGRTWGGSRGRPALRVLLTLRLPQAPIAYLTATTGSSRLALHVVAVRMPMDMMRFSGSVWASVVPSSQ